MSDPFDSTQWVSKDNLLRFLHLAVVTPTTSQIKPQKEAEKATPLEPSGLVEVSEEEFERAKRARG